MIRRVLHLPQAQPILNQMTEGVTAQKAAALVNALHEWVIALAGVQFDPSAVMQADAAAVERLEAGDVFEAALEAGKSVYIAQMPPRRMRVAVVDDESDVRVLLRLSLDADQFQIVGEAATGVEAIEVVGELRPDAVVLDLNMPVLDGAEALKVIKERWPDTNVIVHTAFGDTFKAKLDGLDFDAFVEKTGTFEEIIEQLDRLTN